MAKPRGLKLSDFADHELFFALEAVADEEGWATAGDIAAEIGIDHDRPTRCVATRLAWMNRYGFMEKAESEDGEGLWRLNDRAYDLVHPQALSAAVQRALEGMDEGQRAAVTKAIARELPRSSRQAAHLARRAWLHHFGGWRDREITPKARG